MGGLTQQTKRISRNEYFILKDEIINILTNSLGTNFFIPISVGDKTDFGDIDVHVNCQDSELLRNKIIELFPNHNHVNIHSGISINYKNFQVDFFADSIEKYYFAPYFYSYNCIGNIFGKMWKQLECKYTDKGLYFCFRRKKGGYKKDFLVSRNHVDILKALNVWNFYNASDDNFEFTYRQLYEVVRQSEYFPLTKLSNLNIDKERLLIQKFSQWAKEDLNNGWTDLTLFNDLISEKKPEKYVKCAFFIDNLFGTSIKESIDKEFEQERVINEVSKIFNGNIVMKLTGLRGKELGSFITFCLSDDRINKNKSNLLLIKNVEQFIKEKYNDYKKQA